MMEGVLNMWDKTDNGVHENSPPVNIWEGVISANTRSIVREVLTMCYIYPIFFRPYNVQCRGDQERQQLHPICGKILL